MVADANCFIRVERQTLRKLPDTGYILFTIKVLLDPLAALGRHPEGPRLAQGLRSQLQMLDTAQLAYKGLVESRDLLVEALGREYWPTFMDCIARNLRPGGRAAIQFISMKESLFESYARSADFIQAYVFPGGLLIKTSEFRALAEARGLVWTDQADFGEHYAETLKIWRENFDAAVGEGRLPKGFDERFIRLWRYYLMYCEGGFRGGGIDVAQVTMVKS